MRDLAREIFLELLRSYHDGIGATHSARPQIEVAGHLAKEAELMAAEFNAVTELGFAGESECKSFDITKHEFSDAAKDCHILFNNPSWAGGDLQIEIPDVHGNHADAVLIKEHAIAIAKHFKLTWEDLK